ncbi:MAG TPA: HAD-IIIA family hydrolase [Solirubrobacteraceae bacterium]|jgi:histidinol-phosphate phosphatase family protein|nr:HAD-IIIA family hydrolase [Solirubrobacteraceae bacterium]
MRESASDRSARPEAILFDRDGTLIADVHYNADPARVRPMPGAREALSLARRCGVALAVVSNQSGVARGMISERQLRAVNTRCEELLGPMDAWLHCPHGPGDGCNCRKPAPGLVRRAARILGVSVERCAVIGDIGADMQAAAAAGARGILVPTAETRAQEITEAPETAADLESAVRKLLPHLAPAAEAPRPGPADGAA